jgi:hypothetical protein
MTVTQPEPNVIAVDATVTARGDIGAVFLLLRFPRPGSLAVEFNPVWQTSPSGGSCPRAFGHPVPPGESWDAVLSVQANSDVCPGLAGSGRMATIRFTPAP